MPEDEKDTWFNYTEAGEYLEVSPPKLRELVAEGKLKAKQDAIDKRQKLVSKKSMDALIAESKKANELESEEA